MMDALQHNTDEFALILAAEECRPEQFDAMHKFSPHDQRIIRKLIAHGPVLLQGGRGSGKSAFFIAASRAMAPRNAQSTVLGLYVSLRYVPLLQATGTDYEQRFCEWVGQQIQKALAHTSYTFPNSYDILQLKNGLSELALEAEKRVVLLFDDAAHMGRETSLGAFFDIFRTLSSDIISCKAAIYPGVTEFGTRFDVYNDASVVDVVRYPDQSEFAVLFNEIMQARYPLLSADKVTGFDLPKLAHFLGMTVLGNMRGFIFACNDLLEHAEANQTIGYNALGETLRRLAADYYWPLFDEVKPKLGRYLPAVEAAHEIAEVLFSSCAQTATPTLSVLIHRALVARYAKPFEILEYAGFITRREASRAMKSGGRGSRFAVNLCNLLECIPGSRLTAQLFEAWLSTAGQPVEMHERGEHFANITVPTPLAGGELEILHNSVETLRTSKAYPYGLTDLKIALLQDAGIQTIGDLAVASDETLRRLDGVGEVSLNRFRSVVGQAIWM